MNTQRTFPFSGLTDRIKSPSEQTTIADDFRHWSLNNSHATVALKLFEDECLALADAGATQISPRDVIGDIRRRIQKVRGEQFRVNNNWTRCLADWVQEKHPRLRGLFEKRDRPSEK